MFGYILKRLIYMAATLLGISIVSFIIIQLPPGDFLTTYAAYLRETGEKIDSLAIEEMRKDYGLDQPVYVQYWKWISGIILRGDFSLQLDQPVPDRNVIGDRRAALRQC